MEADCSEFQQDLVAYLPRAQEDFERSLAQSVERSVGKSLEVETVSREGIAKKVGTLSEESMRDLGGSLGHGLSDTVGTAVSAATALVAGTVSGGFGQALGAAILVALLRTSGPVGFLIGAVLGLVVAVAGWWFGRERLTSGISRLHIPGRVVRAALWRGRFDRLIANGREKCRTSVKQLMDAELEPLAPQIAEQIWARLKPALGEQLSVERSD